MLNTLIQLLVSGLAFGFIYALVGIEYTLVWNSTGLLNFSHDRLITLGAYIFGGTFVLGLGADNWLAVMLTLVVMWVVGALVASLIFNPLRHMRQMIFAVMGTIMLGRIMYEGIRLIWGPTPFTVPNWITGNIMVGEISITKANLYICLVAALVLVALQLFMTYTKIGKAMRCVAQNKKAASLMGINVSLNIAITTGVSAIICSIIGMLIIPLFYIDVNMGNMIGLKGFASGVIGGFGYLPGAIVGGIIIGVVENLSTMIIPAIYKDVVSFVLMIVFLLIRPSGLLGKKA